MAYRRRPTDESAERDWRSWVRENGETLSALGLPTGLYSSRSAWEDFLSTGSAKFDTGQDRREFDFNTLSMAQQKALLAFLENDLATREPSSGLIAFLRVRAAHDWIPPFR
jgi:hypothetical protein